MISSIRTVAVCAALAASLLLLPAGPLAADEHVATISVIGEGRVAAEPDMATVTLGVSADAEKAAQAMAQVAQSIGAALQQIAAAGVAERDVQTSGLSLSPRYESRPPSGQAPRVVGYAASSTLTVRVRDLEKLGGLIDAVVESGANTLDGLSFGLNDPEPVLADARARAVADARARAEQFATAAGVSLGAVRSITEAGGYAQLMPMLRMEAAAFADGMAIASGELEISANVGIVYTLTAAD